MEEVAIDFKTPELLDEYSIKQEIDSIETYPTFQVSSQVNEDQLADIPAIWEKDAEDTYSLDCSLETSIASKTLRNQNIKERLNSSILLRDKIKLAEDNFRKDFKTSGFNRKGRFLSILDEMVEK